MTQSFRITVIVTTAPTHHIMLNNAHYTSWKNIWSFVNTVVNVKNTGWSVIYLWNEWKIWRVTPASVSWHMSYNPKWSWVFLKFSKKLISEPPSGESRMTVIQKKMSSFSLRWMLSTVNRVVSKMLKTKPTTTQQTVFLSSASCKAVEGVRQLTV